MDKAGNTPLMIAATHGKDHLVKLFLRHGALVKAQNHFGASALRLAAEAGRGDTVQVMF